MPGWYFFTSEVTNRCTIKLGFRDSQKGREGGGSPHLGHTGTAPKVYKSTPGHFFSPKGVWNKEGRCLFKLPVLTSAVLLYYPVLYIGGVPPATEVLFISTLLFIIVTIFCSIGMIFAVACIIFNLAYRKKR